MELSWMFTLSELLQIIVIEYLECLAAVNIFSKVLVF